MTQKIEKIRPVRFDIAEENEFSERYCQMLMHWVPFADAHFKEWDVRPDCGYFFGGCTAYGTDTSYIVAIFAVLSKTGKYDEQVTGRSRQQLQEKAVKGIRYLVLTHAEGPEDCVRVEGKNPLYSKQKWGREDEGYFRATQTGRSIAALCLAARFLWGELDEETQYLVQKIAAAFADRWSGENPKSGTYNDTQEEENAWTAVGISASLSLFAEHPRLEQWEQGFIKWSMGSVSTYRDSLTQERMVHANTHRTRDVKAPHIHAITVHPDYSTENHTFVHPIYLASGIALRSIHVISALTAGDEILASALYNNENIYDRAIKLFTQQDGCVVPIQGQDWWYNHQHETLLSHTMLNVIHRNRDAARLERSLLERLESLQRKNSNGCFLEANGEQLVLNPMQTMRDVERGVAYQVLSCYLLHAFAGIGVEPSEQAEMTHRLSGVYEYPYGSFIIQRVKNSLSSFSWRGHVMAITLPDKGIWTVTPLYTSYIGTVQFNEKKGIDGLRNDIMIRDTEDYRIWTKHDGFGATATIARGDRELLQDVAFISLPNGHTVYVEQFRVEKNCGIAEMQTGMVGVRNENYATLPDLASGTKSLYVPDDNGSLRHDVFNGFLQDVTDDIKSYPDVPYVNLNDEVGYILFRSRGVKYINRHQFPKWRGLEDILVLNDMGSQQFLGHEVLKPFIVWTIPNQAAEDTKRSAQRSKLLCSNVERTELLETGDYLVYSNFNRREQIVNAQKFIEANRVLICEGNHRIEGENHIWNGRLPAFQSGYLENQFEIVFDTTENVCLDITVSANRIVITNPQNIGVHCSLIDRKSGQKQDIAIDSRSYKSVDVEIR